MSVSQTPCSLPAAERQDRERPFCTTCHGSGDVRPQPIRDAHRAAVDTLRREGETRAGQDARCQRAFTELQTLLAAWDQQWETCPDCAGTGYGDGGQS